MKTHPSSQPSPATPAEAAYAAVEAEIAAVPDAELIPIAIDIHGAVQRILVASERALPLLAEMDMLPTVDTKKVRALPIYAAACLHAHLVAKRPWAGPSLIAEATRVKKDLLVVAEMFVHFGMADAARVAAIRSGHGHVDLAMDLVELGALFRELWPSIGGKSPITFDEVERADRIGLELYEFLGARKVATDPFHPDLGPKAMRDRAFTLMVGAYQHLHRAVAFLRWEEGDADAIAPSLYIKRRRAKVLGLDGGE